MDNSLQAALSACTDRNDLPKILNDAGMLGFAAEIGVAEGGYSEWLRTHWRGMCLYMIDPWLEQPVEQWVDGCNIPQVEQDATLARCRRKMSVFSDESYDIIQAMSLDVVKDFGDSAFDFVYLDGNHNLASVTADIAAWLPKVRPGGILAGHDYLPPCETYGVKTAVDDLCRRTNRRLYLLTGDVNVGPSWAVIV